MKKKGMILVLAGLILLNGGCSSDQPSGGSADSAVMGRYIEEQIEFPKNDNNTYVGMVQDGESIRLVDVYGEDLISLDGGLSFDSVRDCPAAFKTMRNNMILNITETPNGDRIFTEYIDPENFAHYIITRDNQIIQLTDLSSGSAPFFFYGTDGYFYVLQAKQVFRVNPATGEVLFLFESQGYPYYAAADEKRLYVADENGIWIYDLEKMEMAEQDVVLNDFLSGKLEFSISSSHPFLIYPYAGEIYVVTEAGLYQHTLYGETMVQMIDGVLCGIGDISREYVGMAAIEEEDSIAFLIYYSDGNLMRYTYDDSLAAVPETTLRIYGVYEDGSVRQAVSAFQMLHPELYVDYEVGIDTDYGVTLDDALKILSTEMAAGKGPDILIMDDIPFDSYVDKGALMDLSPIREKMEEEEYFVNIIDSFDINGSLYTIPLTFAIPVLGGDIEKISEEKQTDTESLSDLAELLELTRSEKRKGSIFSFVDAKGALRLLAQSSQGAWINEDRTLNKEAVEEFLTQAKRIYDAQMEGLSDEEKMCFYDRLSWGTGENILVNRFHSHGLLNALSERVFVYLEQPLYAGFLSSAADDFPLSIGQLKYLEGGYAMMPGQQYGACLAATLLSINSVSQRKEEAEMFLDYVLSKQFQGNTFLNGTPVNKYAYLMRQSNPDAAGQIHTIMGYNLRDGTTLLIDVYWPTEEDFNKLDNLIADISGVNRCDNRVYEAMIEIGEAVLTGETGIEEAARAIEKRVQLYLAE